MNRVRDLRARLAVHRPADPVERNHLRRIVALLDRAGDPFARDRWVPGHVTSSGYVLSPSEDAVVLVHHVGLDRWLQPGGHVEPHDRDVVAAARREIREETGLVRLDRRCDLPGVFDVDVHRIPERGERPEHAHFDVRFLFRARDTAVRGGSGVREVRWVPLARVADVRPGDSTARILAKIAALRRT